MAGQFNPESSSSSSKAQFPKKLQPIFQPKRYKVLKGGRAGSKSWGIARALLIQGAERKLRVLCTRETQTSIAQSVHHLLKEQIDLLGLESFYRVLETSITGKNGTEFIFAGIRQQNVVNLKSFESVDICWVEEAQVVTKRSWDILIPTIRKDGSEIWVSFNPELETDETYRRFVLNTPPDCLLITINYDDNPFLPETIRREIEHLKNTNPDDFEHIYGGMCKQVVEGAVYRSELLAADKDGRIMRVPYDPTKPVDTFWDLGYSDATAIWFAQSIGFEYRLIDFVQGSQQGLQFYLKTLQSKPYVYRIDYLPHDAQAHQLGSGRSVEEQMRAAGRKVQIVPKLSIEDGIAAARAVFPKCYFDKDNCADGLQALRHYRYEMDEKLGTLKKAPLHDWASNPADAFRYLAVAIREPQRQREQQEREARRMYEPGQQSTGWMS
jgi:phage terminase large subunit